MSATDPVIRCYNDAKALLTTQQLVAWQNYVKRPAGSSISGRMNLYNAWYYNLLNCGGTETRNQVLTKIGE